MSKRRILLLASLGFGCVGSAGLLAARHAETSSSPVAAKGVAAPAPTARPYEKKVELPKAGDRPAVPGLGKARGWLNTTRAPGDADLRGRVVVVDFWTSCCIN